MKPVNTKSIFHTLCDYMEKLDNDEIDVAKASAMSKLTAQANSYLKYELQRAALMINPEFKQEHRNLEMKEFDALPE